jgi:hypothetical protein
MEPDVLRLRARRAYELGRLRRGLEHALWVVPLAGLSWLGGTTPLHALGLAAVLAALVVAFVQRGEVFGRAASHGLMLGGVAAFLPVAARAIEPCCVTTSCGAWCLPACVVGGALAGALLGWRGALETGRRLPYIASAAVVACAAGGFGCCNLVGLGGILGISFGLLVGAPSALWLRAARQR